MDAALTPDAIARALGVSRRTLYLLTADLGGLADYIRTIRVLRALDLLQDPGCELSLQEIARLTEWMNREPDAGTTEFRAIAPPGRGTSAAADRVTSDRPALERIGTAEQRAIEVIERGPRHPLLIALVAVILGAGIFFAVAHFLRAGDGDGGGNRIDPSTVSVVVLNASTSSGLAGAVADAQLEAAQASFDSAQATVDQAQARIATIKSSTTQARARVSEASARLGQASDTEPAQVAEARARAAAAHARVATAEALRDLAKLELSYTKISAPRAGVLSKRSVALGQLVASGQAVVMLVPDAQQRGSVWVTGNFKETQLSHMHIGQPASLTVDAYGRKLRGHVESFSGATGAKFALLPPDNATGNFTKVVQRVPVRIKLDESPSDVMLLPGLSVELTVDTR